MPRALKVTDLPSGLTIRVDRFRHRGVSMRVWTMDVPALRGTEPGRRHDTVLVHGLGVSSEYLQPLALRLVTLGTVHLLDLPGFAYVPRPSGRATFGMGDFADVVLAWLRRAEVERPVLVGHSFGAQVLVEALARRPGAATHAVLVGPTVNDEERSSRAQVARLLQSSVFESHSTRAVVLHAYRQCRLGWARVVLPAMVEHPVEERIAQVPVPLLLVRGTHDHVVPEHWVERLAAAAPDARVEVVEGASHAVVLDHAERLAELVREHVRGTAGVGSPAA
ncbi:alpha/beta fold hydrolase [Cellulomonas endophytica]|uniref:alpha/beta fold hydrolase n=1 Tax=Cellulomonas endophytica TaxID=2494735 RepID=UPI0010135DC5|nr:alpha/beta fold hydrolase [Cellulomonas endophytica]